MTCAFEPDARLRPGMFGRISVVFDQREDVLTVPRTALLEGDGDTAVYRVIDGKALRTPVQVGYLSGDVAEIRAGLEAGDLVVTTGKVALRDGAAVELVDAPPAAAEAVPDTAAAADAADADTGADTTTEY